MPPHLHIRSSLYVSSRVQGSQNLQTELNYLNSFKSYCNSSDFFPSGEEAGGWGVSGFMGVSADMCTHMHAHVYMYRNCKWPPTWRHPCLACLTCMCVCVCMHACDIPHTPISTHPPPLQGGPPESVKIQ